MRGDAGLQYHLSVEPDLAEGETFADQVRVASSAGARGESCGEGIYTTHNPGWWFSQLANEAVGELPRHLYLVRVREPSGTDIWHAHQDLSEPGDVRVLAKLMEAPADVDAPLDTGRAEWLAFRWLDRNPVAASEPFPDPGHRPFP